MKLRLLSAWLAFFETTAGAQIQADLKLNRFQYIAYEPVIVTISITLGRAIAVGEPQAEIDRANQLHVLHCTAPRTWTHSTVALNGQLIAHSTFMEAKSRPRLVQTIDGNIAVRGGMLDKPAAASAYRTNVPKLSDRPAETPEED